jgi:amidohydrolase
MNLGPIKDVLVPDSSMSALIDFRRDLHRFPELRFQEVRTAKLIAEQLQAAGLRPRTGQARTGVVATLGGEATYPHILLRADIDALPTADLKSVPYASSNPGVAHACGHDVHIAVVLGVAQALAARPTRRGRVTFVFQPAEEIPFGETSGGQEMLDTGVLDGVDVVLGLHCWPTLDAGVIGVDLDVAMASKMAFRILVTGIGAHAATPSRGRDALLAASAMVGSLHQLLGREVDPGSRVALNVGTFHGGQSQSIVPSEAELTGTIRTVDEGDAARLQNAVERVVVGLADAAGVTVQVEWKNDMPAVRNDNRLVQRALSVLGGSETVAVLALDQPPMTADDFALYARQRPGLYLKLGVRDPSGIRPAPPLHDGQFDVDERAIPAGVSGLLALIDDLFENGWQGDPR